MIIDKIIFERDNPKEERPGSTLTDKSKTIYRVIIEASNPEAPYLPMESKEERTIPTPEDECAILSEILLALAVKIKPQKPKNPQS